MAGFILVGATAALCGQTSTRPASAPLSGELPPGTRAALAAVEDFTFHFDQPAFYAVVAAVQQSEQAPGFGQAPIVVADWRDLLERPNDFRGQVITIEGVVGAAKPPYTLVQRPDLGPLWQVELQRADQPLSCTVIFTEDASAIPVGARVRVTGYFVMVRRYHGRTRPQQAALLVAPGPSRISQAAGGVQSDGADWRWMLAALAAGVLLALWLFRRAAGRGRTDVRELRARGTAPVNLADDLAAWAQDEPEQCDSRGET